MVKLLEQQQVTQFQLTSPEVKLITQNNLMINPYQISNESYNSCMTLLNKRLTHY